jgi:hypothetical protein
MRKKSFLVALSVIFGLLMNPILVHADYFYKWIDDKGDVHFTDEYSNIPEKYRPVIETRKTPIESSVPIINKKPTSELVPESSKPVEQETSKSKIETVVGGVGTKQDREGKYEAANYKGPNYKGPNYVGPKSQARKK